MTKRLTYGDLERALKELGFHAKPIDSSHQLFEHAATSAGFVMPNDRAEDVVRPSDFVKVRRTLIENGIIEGEAFDRMLHAEPIAV